MKVLCEVSLGELVDKISILKIKKRFISDSQKLKHIVLEETVLNETLAHLKLVGIEKYLDQLVEVNTQLWKIEDDIRDKERNKLFDEQFIELARSVYVTNDLRFKIKSEINSNFGSSLHEVKSYQKY